MRRVMKKASITAADLPLFGLTSVQHTSQSRRLFFFSFLLDRLWSRL